MQGKRGVSSGVAAPSLSLVDRICVLWFLFDGFTHSSLELYYVVLSWFGGAERLQHLPLAWVWMEYGKADRRWQQVDATVMSIELATVGFVAPLCFLLVYGIYHRRPWRHFVQVIVCVCELYGGWMTFAPEWLTGSPSLDTSTFKLLWVYLVFMNGVWVWIPLVLLLDSFYKISNACSVAKTDLRDDQPLSKLAWYSTLLVLVAYLVLVPAVILTV